MSSVHKVNQQRTDGQNGPVTIGGLVRPKAPFIGPLHVLWWWSQHEGLLSHCFHCILKNGCKHPPQRDTKKAQLALRG